MTPNFYTETTSKRNNNGLCAGPEIPPPTPLVIAARRLAERLAVPVVVARAHCEAAGLGREVG